MTGAFGWTATNEPPWQRETPRLQATRISNPVSEPVPEVDVRIGVVDEPRHLADEEGVAQSVLDGRILRDL